MLMQKLVRMVEAVNAGRTESNLTRRLCKIYEELGEASEAYLCVTSPHNYKNKSWEDYREEACDTLIVLIDVFLTPIEMFGPRDFDPIVEIVHNYTIEEQMDQVFAVGHYVALAGAHFQMAREGERCDPNAFYRSLWTACQAAANMCFTSIDGEEPAMIEEKVEAEFVRKLDKWKKALAIYAATDEGWK